MRRSRSGLSLAVIVLAGVVALLGLAAAVYQLASDGWIRGGGTGWMLAGAGAAIVGALAAAVGLRTGRHGLAALGLAVTAVSPTVFAYPLNALLLVASAVEACASLRARRRSARAAVR